MSARKIHWAVGGISVSIKRGEITDFTRFIHPESFKVLFTMPEDYWHMIRNVVLVFQWPIFICGAISILSIGIIAKMSSKCDKTTPARYMMVPKNRQEV